MSLRHAAVLAVAFAVAGFADAASSELRVGPPVNVSPSTGITASKATHHTVVYMPGGGFVTVWGGRAECPNQPSAKQVYVNRYDAGGTLLASTAIASEFPTDCSEHSGSGPLATGPLVAADSQGNFLVVWNGSEQNAASGIFAQRFTAAGVAVGGVIHVNTYTTGTQVLGDVAMTSTGDFIVVWRSDGQDGDRGGIYGQRFNAAAGPLGTEFSINTTTAGHQEFPAVAIQDDGVFLATWSSGTTLDNATIVGRRFDSAAIGGSEFTVGGIQGIAPVEDIPGGFLVAWPKAINEGWVSRYDTAGTLLDSFLVTCCPEYPVGRQSLTVTASRAGEFVAAWRYGGDDAFINYAPNGPRLAIQRFDYNGNRLGIRREIDHISGMPGIASRPNGEWVVTYMNHLRVGVLARRATLVATPPRADFDADGTGDLVLQRADGAVAVWLMDDFEIATGAVVDVLPAGWQIAATGRFDSDAYADLLLHNASTGQIRRVSMNGLTPVRYNDIATVPTDWRIAGTGNVDGEGSTDIVLQNDTTGDVAVWMMTDAGTIGIGGVVARIPTSWKVRATGDSNADTRDDIFLENDATGDVAVWQMAGYTILLGGVIARPASGYRLRTAGDYNGDGRADLAFHNESTGNVAVWLLDGVHISVGAIVATVPAGWVVEASTDLNANGRDDLILRHSASHDVAVWGMNGYQIEYGAILTTLAPGWRFALQPPG